MIFWGHYTGEKGQHAWAQTSNPTMVKRACAKTPPLVSTWSINYPSEAEPCPDCLLRVPFGSSGEQ